MRKSLWVIPVLLLFAAIRVPAAHADSLYTYMFTNNNTHDPTLALTFTTKPIDAVTAATSIAAADLASYSATGPYWKGEGLSEVILDGYCCSSSSAYQGDQDILGVASGTAALYEDRLPIGDYSTPGTYVSFNDTLVVRKAVTEPATFGLMLLGVGWVLVMRIFGSAHGPGLATPQSRVS